MSPLIPVAQAIAEPSVLAQLLDFANKFGGGVIVPVVVALLAYLQLKAKYEVEAVRIAAEKAKVAADLVRETLATATAKTDRDLAGLQKTSEEIKETGEKTHELTNSAFGAGLEDLVLAYRRVANLTKKKEDIDRAELAESRLKDHQNRQAKVDAKEEARVVAQADAKVVADAEAKPAQVVDVRIIGGVPEEVLPTVKQDEPPKTPLT